MAKTYSVFVFALIVMCPKVILMDDSYLHAKVRDISNGLHALLDEIESPVRLTALVCWKNEFAHSMIKAFHASQIGNRQYVMGIFSEDFSRFPFNVQDEHHEMILMDVRCSTNLPNLIEQSRSKMKTHFKWVFINTGIDDQENKMDDQVANLLSDCPILPRSEIYYLCKNADQYVFKQIYRTAMSEPINIEMFGTYEDGIFNDMGRVKTMVLRRQNLGGINLRASMVITNNDSLNHLTDYKDKHIDTIAKSNYVFTNYLVNYLNATVTYSIVPSWGYQDKDSGHWDGMIGQLVQNEADIGATALFMTNDRAGTIQYISMPSATGSKFIFRAPKLSYTDNVFLLPFDDFVWLCLIALVFVTAVFLTMATFVEWKVPLSQIDHNDASALRPSIGDVFLLVFGATCQQGSAVAPKSTTARIIMVVVFIILMFLYTSYSANIVALLQSPSKKIKTLNDLYNSRLKLGVDDTVYNHYFFTHQTEPVRRAIFEHKITNKDGSTNFLNFREGIKLVREGLYAFHVERSVGYQLISETFYEDEKCGLQGIGFFQMTDPWYAIQKNSSYKELMKVGMMRIHEHGLQDRENSRLYTKEPKCAGSGGHFVTASLVDTAPAMLILLWGFGFAIFLFLIEIGVKRYYKSMQRQHRGASIKLQHKFLN